MKNYQFKEALYSYKEDIIYHTKKLINIKSILDETNPLYPFGYENYLALKYVIDLGKSLGFNTKIVNNVCGHIEYGEGEEIFAVLTHVDVVPALGDWTTFPFESDVRDNFIYGRGAIDDKGPTIISLYALKVIKDLKINLKRKIRLIIGTDEETGSRCLKTYLENEKMPDYAISPDASFPLIFAEKGMITIKLTTTNETPIKAVGGVRVNVVCPYVEFSGIILENEFIKKENDLYVIRGESAHAMEPDNGVNAIKLFAQALENKTDNKLINFINKYLLSTRLTSLNLNYKSEIMGDLTMNMGLIEIDKDSNLLINIRYPIGVDYDEFISKFSKICNENDLNLEIISHSKLHYIEPNSDFIKKLLSVYQKYTNDQTKPLTIGGGTYARNLKNAVAFGLLFPNEKETAHEVDECLNIDNFLLGGVIITEAIYVMGEDYENKMC